MRAFINRIHRLIIFGLLVAQILVLALPIERVTAAPILTITPVTWNIRGLDSNDVNVGPNLFPTGVRVCNTGTSTAVNVTSSFVWDSEDIYISLRAGSYSTLSVPTLPAGDCTDFYYDVQITRNSLAYGHARKFHITASADSVGTVSTPEGQEIYVERLNSQSRNGVLDVQVDGVSVPVGGSMNLAVGNTYTLKMNGFTATNGYEQISSFIEIPNTIFKVLSVSTTYTVSSLGSPLNVMYADACGWVNDPASPLYRTCTGTGKAGGDITLTLVVKVIGGTGTTQTMNTLIYDFSGSSYHYNSDYPIRYGVITSEPTPTSTPTGTLTRTPTMTPTIIPSITSSPTSSRGPVLLPSTGFAPQHVTNLPLQAADMAYAGLGDLWLEIPRLGVQTPIVGVPQNNGKWDVSWLGNQTGWLNGTAFPTWAGNSVLTGHVYNAYGNPGPFVHLNLLWWADKVIIHAWGTQYIYEVRQIMQVSPSSITTVIKHEKLPWVTLITCRGYDETSNSYKYRVVVRAVLTKIE